MNDKAKTKTQLVAELVALRQRVAELEQAEQSLRQSEQRLSTLTANLPGAVYEAVLHADGSLSLPYISAGTRQISGLEPQEAMARPELLLERTHPDDRLTSERLAQAELAPHEPLIYESRIISASGRLRWVRDIARVTKQANGDLVFRGIAIDITEQKALEERWRRYEFIANTSQEFMTLINQNRVYEAANDAYCRAHNKTREEIIGRSVAEVWGEERYLSQIKANLDDGFGGGEAYYQGWFEFAGLGRRYFEVAYYPYHNSFGVVTHVVVVSRDATERQQAKEAAQGSLQQLKIAYDQALVYAQELNAEIIERKRVEEALIESEARLHTAIESLPFEFWMRDNQLRCLMQNSVATKNWGNLVGKVPAEADLEPEITQLWHSIDQRALIGEVVRSEISYTQAGQVRFYEDIVAPIVDRGQIRGTLGVSIDITERKQIEIELRQRTAQLETLRQIGLELTAELELNALLQSIASRATNLLESSSSSVYLYQPEKDILGLVVSVGHWARPIGSTLKRGEGLAGAIWQNGQAMIVADYNTWPGRIVTFDPYSTLAIVGVPIYWGQQFLGVLNVADSARLFTPADAELLNLLAIQAAIAMKNARLYTEARESEAQLRAAVTEKEVLLKEIHHRVKNNLQVISSLLNLQAEYMDDPQALDAFADSQYRIKSIALVHEHLYQSENLAQIDFGKYLHHLVNDLLRSYGHRARAVSVQINISEPANPTQAIWLDIQTALPCGLIVQELVSNALKHAFPNGRAGQIWVELQANEPELVLRVSDDGLGLPKDLAFQQTESLGLQLVNMLTLQLNGNIVLKQQKGTSFELTFTKQ